jgi:hypothetical protein
MVGPGRTANALKEGVNRISKRLVVSYVFDWILIVYEKDTIPTMSTERLTCVS